MKNFFGILLGLILGILISNFFAEVWHDKLKVSDLTDFAAVVIAVLAIFISIRHVNQSKKYEKLTFTPYIHIDWEVSGPENYIFFRVSNAGQGPAIIKSFDVFLDGLKVNTADLKAVVAFSENLLSGLETVSQGYYYSKDAIIPANYSAEFIRVQWNKTSDEQKLSTIDIAEKINGRVRFEIGYKSIYDDEIISYKNTF